MFRLIISLIFACQLLILSQMTAYAKPIQQPVASYEVVVNDNANIRSGPGLEFPVVGKAEAGQVLNVVTCDTECNWLQLDSGNWIATFLVDFVDDTTATDNSGADPGWIEPDELEIGEPSPAALDIVQQIVSYTGLPQTFEVYSANIYNAVAMVVEGQRVILYDPMLIEDMEISTQSHWSAISIFAHEIGHHLAGHTLSRNAVVGDYVKLQELEADYFSSFILYKMGATLEEAQSAISQLNDHPDMGSYPLQADRLAAIEEGWREAAHQKGLEALPPPPPDFEEEYPDMVERGYVPTITESETFPDGFGMEVGCGPHEDFRVMYVFEVVSWDPDNSWGEYILEDEQGERKRYTLSLDEMSNATRSWVPTIMEPGRRLKVASAICGNGGFLYLSYVEPLPAASDAATAFDLPAANPPIPVSNTGPSSVVSDASINADDFSPLKSCSVADFDIAANRCLRSDRLFTGTVERIYVSWTPSAAYSGTEYLKKWYLDDVQFLESRSTNEYAYVEVDTRASLKPGLYRMELYADDTFIDAVEFIIR